MKDEVRIAWEAFTVPLAGRVPWMYLDDSGAVRTGIGYLLDACRAPRSEPSAGERARSHEIARALDWRLGVDGPPASEVDIDAEWDLVKARLDLVPRGCEQFETFTKLRLSEDVIDELLIGRLAELEHVLRGRAPFAEFDSWPADAQLGLLSMGWAMGPKFSLPEFEAAAARRDWTAAAELCRITSASDAARDDRDRRLFRNAAVVQESGADPEALVFEIA
ncbi:hypothetical protein [Nocardia bovistercoris]|uniref:Uncharacterized protein n=1 Tax=Nocardia bovistercoris TaxID=2785916 RepID=A0A931N5I2_9NOCA|nr:hypothetical protein [Nocardia bovistercoris]MBH0779436.1 hypothetical protein [Nocardia bovistercoris]